MLTMNLASAGQQAHDYNIYDVIKQSMTVDRNQGYSFEITASITNDSSHFVNTEFIILEGNSHSENFKIKCTNTHCNNKNWTVTKCIILNRYRNKCNIIFA